MTQAAVGQAVPGWNAEISHCTEDCPVREGGEEILAWEESDFLKLPI